MCLQCELRIKMPFPTLKFLVRVQHVECVEIEDDDG
jgi:hypothetical protein